MFIRRLKPAQSAPRSAERGAIVVEMAIVAPVLFFLLFGVIEFGRALNAYMILHNVANEAARSGQQLAELEVTKHLHRSPTFGRLTNWSVRGSKRHEEQRGSR